MAQIGELFETQYSQFPTADLRSWKNQQGWATMGIYQNNGGSDRVRKTAFIMIVTASH